MAQDGESTLRIRARAELDSLRSWTEATLAAARALDELTSAKNRANAGSPGSGGGPGEAPGLPDGATSPSVPPAPNQDGSSGGTGGTALPPPPNSRGAPPMSGRRARADRDDITPSSMRRYQEAAYRDDYNDDISHAAMARYQRAAAAEDGGGGGGGGGTGGPSWGRRAIGAVGNFVSRAAATAVGMGLGSSIEGFVLGSGQKFMELDRILTHLGARFDATRAQITDMGHSMGYTIGQTAGMIEAYGQFRDTLGTQGSRKEFRQALGFGRATGMDPTQAVALTTGIGYLSKSTLGRDDLAGIMGMAGRMHMGGARLGEYMSGTESLLGSMLDRTGVGNVGGSLALQNLPGLMFGFDSPLAQGARGLGAIGQIDRALTSNDAVKIAIMRQSGFGAPGSKTSMSDMAVQLEGGAYDPRNIQALFSLFQEQGLNPEQMQSVLRSHGMSAISARGLVVGTGQPGSEGLGGKEGFSRFVNLAAGAREEYLASLDPSERARYESGGFVKMGAANISEGESRGVKIENAEMEIGKQVAEVMSASTDAMLHVLDTIKKITGDDLGASIAALIKKVDDLIVTIQSAPEAYERVKQVLGNPKDEAAAQWDILRALAYMVQHPDPTNPATPGGG